MTHDEALATARALTGYAAADFPVYEVVHYPDPTENFVVSFWRKEADKLAGEGPYTTVSFEAADPRGTATFLAG